jgi:bacteriocin-like protein
LSLAQETGYDLSDDELEAISGGWNPFEKCEDNDKSF